MKTNFKLVLTVFIALLVCGSTYAQNQKLAAMPLDSKGIVLDPQQLGNLLRIELDKTNMYKVMDSYDVEAIMNQNNIKPTECYSKSCLIQTGKLLNTDKIVSGSVERYGEKIIITLRMFDVASGSLERTQVDEFLNLQTELQSMIQISLRTMLNLKNDGDLVKRLSKVSSYESSVNNPGAKRLSLSGPRMGLTFITGNNANRIMAKGDVGGFEAYPVMSQFGYQFETQYLNSGDFQALVEFVPLVTGIDQGLFIPSLTLLNGFRNNKNGWEFAFGPTAGFARKASGYYDDNGKWNLEEDWAKANPNGSPNQHPIVEALDKRGPVKFVSGFVFVIGKTFKSGDLNIPLNMYLSVPDKDGWRVGMSFGFNTKK
jgi:hypothetical protein